MSSLPTKSQIRAAIQPGQPPSLTLDRLICLCFMPFYSVPPPFSTNDEAANQIIAHFQHELGRSMELLNTGEGRWWCMIDTPEPLRFEGSTSAHAIVNAALWYAGCTMCTNDEE